MRRIAVLLDETTKLIVQGITGHQGKFHTRAMLDYGTKVVAGVTPGKAGEQVNGVPVYDSCFEAVDATGANASILFVPAPYAKDAAIEAIEAGIELLVMITERIPFHDCLDIVPYARSKGCRVIGPNCPGITSAGKAKAGIMPNHIFRPGDVGVISRSGTLTYEIIHQLSSHGFGQSTCVGIGGDPIIGTSFLDCLAAFEADPETDAVVMIGEIGGSDEQRAAEFVQRAMTKPVLGFIAGQTAPPGRRMGHAGAIVSGSEGTAADKIAAFERAGIGVMKRPADVVALVRERL